MYLPITRSQWLEKKEKEAWWRSLAGDPFRDYPWEETDVLTRNANWLLERLYKPDAERGAVVVKRRDTASFWGEPINWGDLSAVAEQQEDGTFLITLEEAAPECPNLCAYIKDWLVKWGWQSIEVVSEW